MSVDEFARQYAKPQYLVPMGIMAGVGGLLQGRTGAVLGALVGVLIGAYVLPAASGVIETAGRINDTGARAITQAESIRQTAESMRPTIDRAVNAVGEARGAADAVMSMPSAAGAGIKAGLKTALPSWLW